MKNWWRKKKCFNNVRKMRLNIIIKISILHYYSIVKGQYVMCY